MPLCVKKERTLRVLRRIAIGGFDALREAVNRTRFGRGNAGEHDYLCPVCDCAVESFLPYVRPAQQNAICPVCGAEQRHRLDWIFFNTKTNLFDGIPKRMLHVAPEPWFYLRMARLQYLDYVSVDLESPRASQRMDITSIAFAENTFDVIYCSHVLEHVTEDKRALRELFRVCKPGGWALLQVPVGPGKTYEDSTIVSKADRLRIFGQEDHCRRCGLDYAERMQEAGWRTTVFASTEILPKEELARYGIDESRWEFYCEKRI